MSFLAPLYLLGIAAAAAPIVLHLVRRAPRGEVVFSSLMYLKPTPPVSARRSRLEHLLLMLLRIAALCLLAFAFARPYLSRALPGLLGPARERVMVLVDTSASMRRGDAWPKAVALARKAIESRAEGDELAVFAFDTETRPLLAFSEARALDPAARRATAIARVEAASPSWRATRLGQALIEAVAALDFESAAEREQAPRERRIVLVSDLERGGRLEALGDFDWPSNVQLEIEPVELPGANASLTLAEPGRAAHDRPNEPRRVVVSNEPGHDQDAFTLVWSSDGGKPQGAPIPVHVPPGESRVVSAQAPAGLGGARVLTLKGDAYDFDNMVSIAVPPAETIDVVYLGNDRADDPAGARFFLERAFENAPGRTVRVLAEARQGASAWPAAKRPGLVVIAAEPPDPLRSQLVSFVESGGLALVLLGPEPPRATLATLAQVDPRTLALPLVSGDWMLGQIDFAHPLFAPFAGAGFNDFTRIHFWKICDIKAGALGGARIVARFESGAPAVVELARGKGRVVVLASSWRPVDSQLARSSKFVPLLATLLESGAPGSRLGDRIAIGDPVPLAGAEPLSIKKPDGSTALATGVFKDTDSPGFYTATGSSPPFSFAVNLDPQEGRTAPVAREVFEQYGCRLSRRAPTPVDVAQVALERETEQESRQKAWRPIIVSLLGVLLLETLLAGRARGRAPTPAEAFTS